MRKDHFSVLILGGGTGGIGVAARLRKHFPVGSVAIMEPSHQHFYQPLWTLVGGGVLPKEKSLRSEKELIPKGVMWIEDKVKKVDPSNNLVETESGNLIAYNYLVVATGLIVDYPAVKGVVGNLGKNGLCSIYEYDGAEKTAEMLNDFRGGKAIFTMPPVPIKCAGAPQKIMYLADEIFRRNKVRGDSTVTFATAGKVIFGVPEFAKSLMKVVERKGIDTLFSHRLIEVLPAEKKAIFEVPKEVDPSERRTLPYDLLHVVPPMRAHDYVRESGLAFEEGPQKGWLRVDKHTLQHEKYANIFGVGDVTGVPNSKTGAAIRKQTPVVVENLLCVMSGKTPHLKYDGYSSCPLVTEFGKVILAEFGYDGKLMPTFPVDQTKERRSMWFLKRHLLPLLYWKGMMKGRA